MNPVNPLEGLREAAHRATGKLLPLLTSTTPLAELELDSFDWVSTLAELDLRVPPRELERLRTVGELLARMPAQGPAAVEAARPA